MIITNYLTKHTTKAQLSVLFVLLVVFVSKKFLQTLSSAAEGNYPASLIMELLWLNLPQIICFVLPFSFFLGLLFGHSHLYASHEMTAIRALGFAPSLIVKNTLQIAAAHTLIYTLLWFWVVPICNYKMDALFSNLDVHTQVSTIIPGRFMQIDHNTVVYTEAIHESGMFNRVFIAHKNLEPYKNDRIIVANQGQIEAPKQYKNQSLKLNKGIQYYIPNQGLNLEQTEFQNYFMTIVNPTRSPERALDHLIIQELKQIDTLYGMSYYQWKVAMPLMIPILALLAIPLAQVKPRKGRFAKIMPAIILYLVYYITFVTGRRLLEQEVLSEQWGLWWIHLIFLLFALLQLGVHYQKIPSLDQWRQKKLDS